MTNGLNQVLLPDKHLLDIWIRLRTHFTAMLSRRFCLFVIAWIYQKYFYRKIFFELPIVNGHTNTLPFG